MIRYIGLFIFGLFIVLSFISLPNAQIAFDEKEKNNSPKSKSLEEEIAESVENFFTSDFGDTEVSFRENEKKAFEKLVKKFDGRNLKINFPIEDISVEQGKYVLTFGKPDFPGKLEYSYLKSTGRVQLSKKQAT